MRSDAECRCCRAGGGGEKFGRYTFSSRRSMTLCTAWSDGADNSGCCMMMEGVWSRLYRPIPDAMLTALNARFFRLVLSINHVSVACAGEVQSTDQVAQSIFLVVAVLGFTTTEHPLRFSALFRVLKPLRAVMECNLCSIVISRSVLRVSFTCSLPAGFTSPVASQPHGMFPFLFLLLAIRRIFSFFHRLALSVT